MAFSSSVSLLRSCFAASFCCSGLCSAVYYGLCVVLESMLLFSGRGHARAVPPSCLRGALCRRPLGESLKRYFLIRGVCGLTHSSETSPIPVLSLFFRHRCGLGISMLFFSFSSKAITLKLQLLVLE